MGICYSAPSKRSRTVDGYDILFSNFFGKAPSIFAENTRRWNAFCTRAANTALQLREDAKYSYIMFAKDGAEMSEYGEAGIPVAAYNGQEMLSDMFWDKNTIGYAKKVNGRWQLVRNKEEQ